MKSRASAGKASVDYLNYDRLGKIAVHQHLPGGAEWLHHQLEEYDTERAGA